MANQKKFSIKKLRWAAVGTLTLIASTIFLFQNCAHDLSAMTAREQAPVMPSFEPLADGEIHPIIAAGNGHTCVTNRDGKVFCWGKNRLGLSGGANQPVEVLSPTRQKGLGEVVQIAAGNDANCALTKSGTVYCWGSNGNWGLGVPNALSGPTPVKVLDNVTFIDGNYHHFCAVVKGGRVKCWGNSAGVESIGNSAAPEEVRDLTDVEKVNVAYTHACAVLKSKKLRCWGAAHGAKLYEAAATLENVAQVDAGLLHICAMTTDGEVSCWGGSAFGQSGVDGAKFVSQPAKVMLPKPAKKLAAGAYSTCALLTDGSAQCWGNNVLGQLGLSSTQPMRASEPKSVMGIESAVDLAMGADHACALLKNFKVRCWGVNAQGQLGNGSLALGFSASPIEVTGLPRL